MRSHVVWCSCIPDASSQGALSILRSIDTPGADEAIDKCCRDQEKDDVEDGRVDPPNRRFDHHLGVANRWLQVESTEDQLDDVSGHHHGDVESAKDEVHHLPSVVLPVDHEDWQDDEVGEDECHHAAEADATLSLHAGCRRFPEPGFRTAVLGELVKLTIPASTVLAQIASATPSPITVIC